MGIRAFVVSMIVLAGCSSRPVVPPDPPFVNRVSEPADIREIAAACQRDDERVLPACLPDEEGPSSRRLDEALDLHRQGKYREALPILTEIIDGKTGDGGCAIQKAYFTRGKAYFRLGRYREAFDDHVRFIQAGEDSFYYWSAAHWLEALQEHLPRRAVARCIHRLPLVCWPKEDR